ncbi:MAG TPA: 2-dehydropantoate 2-reductase [Symbiobacteriaceae bacterium]|nr:2-dehydropantoate 2-reductase [Symbiobacteriaceae bacterium]
MMRIGILGAGALGSLFAYYLSSRTSHEVWLLARSAVPPQITVVGEGTAPVRVATACEEKMDLLLVMVKAYATADAIRWAAGAVGPETVALTLQNGLGNAEVLAEALGAERVLAGTTAQGATWLAPGHIRHGGAGPTHLAPWAPAGRAADLAPTVATLLNIAGLPAGVTADPRPLLWAKLAVNCGINALTAILRVPNGELLGRSGARRLMESAAAEAGAVAAAEGVPLRADPVERVVAVARATAANHSSMLQDVERGRRTEVDAINGAVARRGRQFGVPAPVNEALADLVRSLS